MITKETLIYVTNVDCTTPMPFQEFCDAIKGDLKLDEIQITFDRHEANELEDRRRVIERINEQLKSYDLKFAKRLYSWMASDAGWHYLNQ